MEARLRGGAKAGLFHSFLFQSLEAPFIHKRNSLIPQIFIEYLYYVPETVLSARDTMVNKRQNLLLYDASIIY